MKTSAFRFTLMLCLTCILVAEEPKPLLMVMEADPWASVIGSDSPVLAIYSDGAVIYRKHPDPTAPTNQTNPYLSRVVPKPDELIGKLLSFDMAAMPDQHALSSATDQVTTDIWTPAKTIRIYGDWHKPRDFGSNNDPATIAIATREEKMWASLPAKLREALTRLEDVRRVEGTPWLPAKIEIVFWPWENAVDPSTAWPKGWPGLSDKETRKRGTDSYSVYLAPNRFNELRRLLASRKEKGAILIDGKKMALAYRFPFPGEDAWMKPPQ
jgi:hypothetical protein